MTARDRPVRVLLTVDAIGGIWQYATDLARALVPLGYESVLALLGGDASAGQRTMVAAIPGAVLIETGLPLDWLATTPNAVRDAGQRIADLAARLSADLVHLNHPAFADSGRWPVPLLAVAHSCLATWWHAVDGRSLPPDFAWRVAQHGRGLRSAARVVTPSRAFAAATVAAYSLATRPDVVHNGRTVATGPAPPMANFAFTAGRLWDRGKNLTTLDRTAARTGVAIRAAGGLTGPDGDTVVFPHLQTLGPLDDAAIAACLGQRPVFVSSARYEPFGLAVLEAAAAGCALVLADIPTFRELWGDTATFVAPDDHAGFAAAIDGLIADPRRRETRGQAARAAAAQLTPARMARDTAAIYTQLLAPADARARAAA